MRFMNNRKNKLNSKKNWLFKSIRISGDKKLYCYLSTTKYKFMTTLVELKPNNLNP